MEDIAADQAKCREIAEPILPGLFSVLDVAHALYFGSDYSDRAGRTF